MKNWKESVEEINKNLELDPPYTTESEEAAIQEITERQETEDAFRDEDYIPEKKIGLSNETVGWLIKNEVPVPEKWEKRYLNETKETTKEEAEEEEEETKEEKPKKKAKKTKSKAEKKLKKEKKPKKEKRAKNEFGHGIGTIADQIDQLLKKGVTIKEIEEAGIKAERFHVHCSTMKREKPFVKVWKEDNKYFAALKEDSANTKEAEEAAEETEAEEAE